MDLMAQQASVGFWKNWSTGKSHIRVGVKPAWYRYDISHRYQDYLVKIKAFAEVCGLDKATITEGLIHSEIKATEQAMLYAKGSQIIRIKDGEEIFADADKTPVYVEAEQAISKTLRDRVCETEH